MEPIQLEHQLEEMIAEDLVENSSKTAEDVEDLEVVGTEEEDQEDESVVDAVAIVVVVVVVEAVVEAEEEDEVSCRLAKLPLSVLCLAVALLEVAQLLRHVHRNRLGQQRMVRVLVC